MPTDWPSLIPVLILAGGATLILCLGAFGRRLPRGALFALALAIAGAAGAAALVAPPGHPGFEGMLDLSGFTRFFTCLFMVITVLTCLFLRQYARARGFDGDELYGLLLFAALGMVLVAGALDWLIFFLGLELLSLCLYVLIAVQKGEAASGEAGIKYFIMGAVASAFLTFGIALLYGTAGTLKIAASLAPAGIGLPGPDLLILLSALSFILVGIGFKISLVPFHLWTPDVYQGAPAPVTAFLSTGSKVALFAVLLRLCGHLALPAWEYALPALWLLAALTMVVGTLTALAQTRLKRLLAYSSVSQMGYLLMTLLAVKQGGTAPILFYLVVYAVMELGAFGILGTFSTRTTDLDALEDYRGLGYSQPWRAAILAVCLISLLGLPPTAGFMGKLVLFKAVLQAQFVVLAVIGILTVIISIFFYLKVVVILYMHPAEPLPAIRSSDVSIRLAGAVVLILILWLGLMPGALLDRVTAVSF